MTNKARDYTMNTPWYVDRIRLVPCMPVVLGARPWHKHLVKAKSIACPWCRGAEARTNAVGRTGMPQSLLPLPHVLLDSSWVLTLIGTVKQRTQR